MKKFLVFFILIFATVLSIAEPEGLQGDIKEMDFDVTLFYHCLKE